MALLLLLFHYSPSPAEEPLAPPELTNNPSLDVVVTSRQPLFSFFGASGGTGAKSYTVQIDTEKMFDSEDLIEYRDIPEEKNPKMGRRAIVSKRLEQEGALVGKTVYFWRARAVDENGAVGPWASSRFYYDPSADDAFMDLVRIPVVEIEVSSGQNAKNIIDIDDPGQSTFWQAAPPGEKIPWVIFDFGRSHDVSRIWMLSNPDSIGGRLKDFKWQKSDDGSRWSDIEMAAIKGNGTFRNIIMFSAIRTRYLRLLISGWYGYAPQINAIILYSPGKPPVPEAPDEDYVLIVGNQQDGGTFTELVDFVGKLDTGLRTITVPHYEVSLEMVENLDTKPVAIILSGNNADYSNLPMFEFNGEYELIRESDIPILGICCGHQQLAMAYGYTYAKSMGWEDISALEEPEDLSKIRIERTDPVFEGIPDPFTAAEVHGWAIAVVPKEYEIIADSSYIQAIRNANRMIYGEQFHAEINVEYNQGGPYLKNFLRMALEKYKKQGPGRRR
ncbi:discoidin domain-containing protein [Candidatus Omnitrophota bacterium]